MIINMTGKPLLVVIGQNNYVDFWLGIYVYQWVPQKFLRVSHDLLK